MELLIDGKPRKIVFNKIDNIYYYKCKEGKIDITHYFKKNRW